MNFAALMYCKKITKSKYMYNSILHYNYYRTVETLLLEIKCMWNWRKKVLVIVNHFNHLCCKLKTHKIILNESHEILA